MELISVVLTSCGRHDLLDQTITSFNNTNTYPIDEFIIINDTGKDEDFLYLKEKYNTNYKILQSNKTNNTNYKSQLLCIDMAYSQVKNNYIFHMEDDWLFEEKNNYIENSLTILENYHDIHQVWIRHQYDNPHAVDQEELNLSGVSAFRVDKNFRGCWNGFSFNPGLRRIVDYRNFFPNGYSEFENELGCTEASRKNNYSVVVLKNTTCRHIGYSKPTQRL